MQIMRTHSHKIILLLIITFAVIINSSCEKLSEDVDVAKALVGQWRGKAISVDIMVEGMDLVQYLIENLEYSNEHAIDINDSLIADIRANSFETIKFGGDRICKVNVDKTSEKEGSWSIDADGENLFTNIENETIEYQILMITANSLSLKNTFILGNIDLDNDGVGEPNLDILMERDFSKSSNGGSGG